MNRIFIAFPTYDRRVDIDILLSMIRFNGEFAVDYIATSIISRARNYLVTRFLERSNMDWMFFWDSDVVIRDTDPFTKLIETSKALDAGIVGAAYRMKNNLNLVVGGNLTKGRKIKNDSSADKYPRIVDAVGTGAMLIRRDVLETVPAPWFFFKDERDYTHPEDYNFCLKAKKYGFKTAIDPTITTLHYGQMPWAHLSPEEESTPS